MHARLLAVSLALPTVLSLPARAQPAPDEPPVLPAVDDPMLAPVPPPARAIESWQQALALVRARSTDLRMALADVERAEAQSRTALAALFPTVTGSANITGNLLRGEQTSIDPATLSISTRQVPDAWTYGGSVALTQPLVAPRAWWAIGTAERAEANARLGVESQKRLLVAGAAQAIVGVVTGERVAELNRIGLRAALERAELTRRRSILGAANALDVVRAEQDVAVARAAVVSGDESLRQAREALGLALGFGEGWGVVPGVDLGNLETSARAVCSPAPTIDQRPDIAAARGSVDLAGRLVGDAWRQFSPTVNLTSTLNATSTAQANTRHVGWTIAGILTVPIWDGGLRYGTLRDARAQVDQSSARLEAARRGATVEVARARRGVEVAEASHRISVEARDLAARTEQLARAAFAAGRGTSLDLVESGRRLREAETQLALREFELVRARIAALLALATCSV